MNQARSALGMVAALVVGTSSLLVAQDSTYFHALAIPTRSVGTCVRDTLRGDSGRNLLTQYKLVMTSSAPFRRREIGVRIDTAGRVVSYDELGFESMSLGSSEGESIIAAIDANGRVHGWRIQSSTVIPDSMIHQLDTARLRKLQKSGVTKSSREPLDVGRQRRVLEMAEWLRERCPA